MKLIWPDSPDLAALDDTKIYWQPSKYYPLPPDADDEAFFGLAADIQRNLLAGLKARQLFQQQLNK